MVRVGAAFEDGGRFSRGVRGPAPHNAGDTVDFKANLETELKALERELRVELPKEIKRALAMGDLRENAEYQAALERQSFVRARIGQLKNRLADLSNIRLEDIPTDRIGLGSVARVLDLDEDKEISYEFVVPDAADPASGKISMSSPLGKGLSGHQVGDEVMIQVPSGQRTYEVLSLQTIHQRK
jgi:transcription elongation factor GreA